jgi:RNA polymerase sigma factor (sigma-70 family)
VKEYSAEEIIKGIRLHDEFILQFLYQAYFPLVKNMVNYNSGQAEDAFDIYQEALIVIYKKAANDELKLVDCSFKTYLYSVCKLLWLKQLKKSTLKNSFVILNEEEISEDQEEIIQLAENNRKFTLFQTHFLALKKDCQKVIELSLNKVSMKEVAKLMGYKNEDYAKKKKYQCKEKLIKQIRNDPKFKEFE